MASVLVFFWGVIVILVSCKREKHSTSTFEFPEGCFIPRRETFKNDDDEGEEEMGTVDFNYRYDDSLLLPSLAVI